MRIKNGFRSGLLCSVMLFAQLSGASPATIRRVANPALESYIVELNPDTRATDNATLFSQRAGARVEHVYDAAMNGFSIRGTEQQALAIARMQGVVSVTEVSFGRPTDVMFNAPQGLDRIDQRALPLDGTFTFSTYATPTNIYIVDTGVDPHPDFGNRLVTNKNFVSVGGSVDASDWTDNGRPEGDYFHGTPAAVVAAGSPHGIARWAKIHNVRVCSSTLCRSADVIAGVDFVTAQRNLRPSELHIANASFTMYADANPDAAFINSMNAGVAWVFAAGNGWNNQTGNDACQFHPAMLAATKSGSMAVGAAFPDNDVVELYSNQGPCVEIFAPGQVLWGHPIHPDWRASGTSIAAPHVTGVFAARWANSPTSSAAEIEGLVKGIGTAGVLTGIWPTSPNLLLHSVLPRRRPSGP